jgi:hypothetical protein
MFPCAQSRSESLLFSVMADRKDKKHSLYYLLPGMTRANREKRKRIFWYSVVVGIAVSALVGAIIYLVHRGPQP